MAVWSMLMPWVASPYLSLTYLQLNRSLGRTNVIRWLVGLSGKRGRLTARSLAGGRTTNQILPHLVCIVNNNTCVRGCCSYLQLHLTMLSGPAFPPLVAVVSFH